MMTVKTNERRVTRRVPAKAMRFDVVSTVLDAARETAEATLYPFAMTARTAGVAEHWYWGPMVHDFGGMRVEADRIAVDYCHDHEQPLGYVDRVDVSRGELRLSGVLVSLSEDDLASQVARKAQAGIPYQASIMMGAPLVYEELGDGASAIVNGQIVAGPATVFREWTLRGVAICLYGSDSRTSVEFSDAGGDGDVEVSGLGFVSGGGKMDAERESSPVRDGIEYLNAFGDLGGRWFAEGKTFEECQRLFIAELRRRLDEKTAEAAAKAEELEKLRASFATLAGGSPVSFAVADAPRPQSSRQPMTGLDRFARSLFFAGTKDKERD